MKHVLNIVLMLLFLAPANSQDLQHIWSHTFGDGEGEDDWVESMCTDTDGNIYAGGALEGLIDFDPSKSKSKLMVGQGRPDAYVAKYDSLGKLYWAIKLESESNIKINEIALDHSNNILVAGYFTNRLDFDPSENTSYAYSGTSNNASGFVAKYSNNGKFIWGINIGGNSVDNATCLAISANNSIVVAGGYSDTVDFDLGAGVNQQIAPSGQDIFVAKYDSLGKHLWAFSINASVSDYAQEVEVDKKGDIIVAGTFSNTADFDPSSNTQNLTRAGRNDVFLAKYSSAGNYIWAKAIGGTGNEYAHGLEISNGRMIYLTGTFESTVDFDPSSSTTSKTSNGRGDVFLAKYDTNGDFEWVSTFGSSNNEVINDIELDKTGNAYLTGYIISTTDFDPSSSSANLTPVGSGDVYVAKYDSSGNYEWAKRMGNTNFDTGTALALDSFNHIWAGGYFAGTVDFDPGSQTQNLSTPDSRNFSSYFGRYHQNTGNYKTAWSLIDRLGGNDEILGMAHDSKGSVYITGYFNGSIDFDPSFRSTVLNAHDDEDAFLAKYDSLGKLSWAIRLGEDGNDRGLNLACDHNDNVIVCGYFSDSIDLDPSAANAIYGSNGNIDLFVAKYDNNGNYKWGYGLGGRSSENPYALTVDSANNVWMAGAFRSVVDFNPGVGSASLTARNDDIFLTKYDQFGNFKFARFIGGSSNNIAYNLVSGSNNAIYMAGEFRNTCDFAPGSTTANKSTSGSSDPFVAKYDSLGFYDWVVHIAGSGTDKALGVDLDARENVYVVGNFQSSNDFDPSTTTRSLISGGGDDGFVASYNKNGDYRWALRFGDNRSTRWDRCQAVSVEKDVVNITGYFSDTVDFNPKFGRDTVFISTNTSNPFILKLDTLGQFKEAAHLKSIRGQGNTITTFNGKAFVGGVFQTEIDLNPNASISNSRLSNGDNDFFLAQYGFVKPCVPTYSTVNTNVCGPYKTPSGKFIYTSGQFKDTISNNNLCDSIITINLTVKNSYATVDTLVCRFYLSPSRKLFDSTGIYLDTIPNYQSCDSIITINLTVATSFNRIDVTACDSFVSPSGKYLYSKSGFYTDTLTNSFGCDSLIAVKLTINNTTRTTINPLACDSLLAPSGKFLMRLSGTYYDTLTTNKNCDSIITINATINETRRSKISPNVCGAYTSPNNKTFTASGTYFDTISTVNNCDSIIEIELTIKNASFGKDSLIACDSLVSPSGKYVYHKSGTYTDTITNTQGCDSIITLNITIDQPWFKDETFSACDSFISPSGNYTYTKSGVYWDTIPATVGCDSVFMLTVFIYETKYLTIDSSSCNAMLSPSGKYTYTTTGVYFDTLKTKWRCDSIITINYQRFELTSSNIEITACNEYTAPSGKYIYNTTGFYTDTISNVNGCDSIITIALTIIDNSPTISFSNNTLSVDLDSLKYQWFDCKEDYVKIDTATRQEFRPATSGEYTVVVYEESCADTAACLDVEIVGKEEIETNEISVYPNPSKEVLFISSKVKSLKVISLEGKLLLKENNAKQINIASLAPSIYFVEIETRNHKVERFRFVKE
ncbi:MAG: T9SS type A sorting domain-containing protein [Bacteroidia bacterium]